ncbi:FUSC family membrane protein [Niveibacterium sp. SC-1]|uniref:FUSC family protein n=1 Tax=Niveibacterium sp. SC-1 TaxID=3135646 RepID=UPI00311F997A
MNLQRILFGHKLYNGVGCALGVFAVAMIGYAVQGIGLAMAMSAGALTLSANDLPCPPGGKLRQLLPALLGTALVTALAAFGYGHPWGMGALVMAVGFVAPMMTAFGRPGLPLGFSLVFALVFGMALPADAHGPVSRLLHFAGGGCLYLLYALLLNRVLRARTKSQVLADALHGFADFLRDKAMLLREHVDHEAWLQTLIRQQAGLAERLQSANEFVFRKMGSREGQQLANVLLAMHDAYEYALALHTDQELLHRRYGASGLLGELADGITRGAVRMDEVAGAIMRGDDLPQGTPLVALLEPVEHAVLAAAAADVDSPEHSRAAVVLRGLYAKTAHLLGELDALAAALAPGASARALPRGIELREWVTRVRYRPGALLAHLRNPDSPILRFALRSTLALTLGYVLVLWLPYASHGHWVLLTIAVVMRSSYSQTRQRRTERIVGTAIGCVLVGALLRVIDAPLAILPVLVLAMAVAHAFVTIDYRYAATAASVAGLLQLHLLAPGLRFVISERIADTLIGALIAWACSFVLANWESESLPRLTRRALEAVRDFAAIALQKTPPTAAYRLARKRMLDAQGDLSAALGRMADEPESRRHPLEPFESLLAHNYALAAQLASLRFLVLRNAEALQASSAEQEITATRDAVTGQIEAAMAGLVAPPPPQSATPGASPETDALRLLQRRLALIGEQAYALAEAKGRLPA